MKMFWLFTVFVVGFWCGHWDAKYGEAWGYKAGVWTRELFTDSKGGES